MERFKKFLRKFLFPGFAVVLISVPVAAVLLIYTFLYENEYSPIANVSYVVSAYSLTIVCAYIIKVPKPDVKGALHRNQHIHRYLTDLSFKTHVSLYLSLGFNLLFVAMKLFYGMRYRSVWYGTLGVYYIMLAVMRFLLLRYANRSGIGKDPVSEWKHYRWCGIMLLLMNIALLGVVVLVVLDNEGFSYEGYLIYVVAMYDFCNISIAVRDIVKYRNHKSAVISAERSIKFAAALVSMLSLETAMLAQFDEGNNPQDWRLMTGLTGGSVCLIVFVMAVYMIVRSSRQMKQVRKCGME